MPHAQAMHHLVQTRLRCHLLCAGPWSVYFAILCTCCPLLIFFFSISLSLSLSLSLPLSGNRKQHIKASSLMLATYVYVRLFSNMARQKTALTVGKHSLVAELGEGSSFHSDGSPRFKRTAKGLLRQKDGSPGVQKDCSGPFSKDRLSRKMWL